MPAHRPELPIKHQNPNLKSLDLSKWSPVKYQCLDRDGHEVLVGRLKIPTPSGHAFILRRYDTGAISLTTMFRAAFPEASEIDERKETQWAKENFELAGNNGSAREPAIVRLAGTWISPTLALSPDFADAYHLRDVIQHIAKATPDPKATYRRSTAKGTPKACPAIVSRLESRQGVAHPCVLHEHARPQTTEGIFARTVPCTTSCTTVDQQSTTPPSICTDKKPGANSGTPRLSNHRNPVRIARAVRVTEVTTPAGSDETVVEEEAETIELAKPSMTQDIAEQKELIERLKAERDLAKMQTDDPVPEAAPPLKREREDEKKDELRFNFKEPETGERQMVTNKRVSRFQLEPRNKSFAWGVAAFAIGMGAVSFLPNFF
ncbi:hypothetical protein JVU11DRAFT_3934 [Chiua virens]|nr:hypothetical protein JVU11DRAFT_3934 [Chiua virens]